VREYKGCLAMSNKISADQLKQRFRRLASKLAATGPIVQGTITERVITRSRDEKGKAEKTYGPYYQWTFKSAGKTTTVNLTSEQAKLFQEAIGNNQEVEKTLKEMRTLSKQICEVSVEGVKKRKPGKKKKNTLSSGLLTSPPRNVDIT
jgi:hypothetical protein